MKSLKAKLAEMLEPGFEPEDVELGICNELKVYNTRSLRYEALKGWEHYSGDLVYPILGPNGECGYRAFMDNLNVWKGEYGRRRMELVQRMYDLCPDDDEE